MNVIINQPHNDTLLIYTSTLIFTLFVFIIFFTLNNIIKTTFVNAK